MRTFRSLCLLGLSALLGACNTVTDHAGFVMPDGQTAEMVTLAGNGVTPPVVAVITPRASPYNVQLVSATPVLQAALQGAVAGVAVGGGLAAQGALVRPDRVVNSNTASGQGGNATGGSATGGTGTGGTACIASTC